MTPYELGYMAALDGYGKNPPYEDGSIAHYHWNLGYDKATLALEKIRARLS